MPRPRRRRNAGVAAPPLRRTGVRITFASALSRPKAPAPKHTGAFLFLFTDGRSSRFCTRVRPFGVSRMLGSLTGRVARRVFPRRARARAGVGGRAVRGRRRRRGGGAGRVAVHVPAGAPPPGLAEPRLALRRSRRGALLFIKRATRESVTRVGRAMTCVGVNSLATGSAPLVCVCSLSFFCSCALRFARWAHRSRHWRSRTGSATTSSLPSALALTGGRRRTTQAPPCRFARGARWRSSPPGGAQALPPLGGFAPLRHATCVVSARRGVVRGHARPPPLPRGRHGVKWCLSSKNMGAEGPVQCCKVELFFEPKSQTLKQAFETGRIVAHYKVGVGVSFLAGVGGGTGLAVAERQPKQTLKTYL